MLSDTLEGCYFYEDGFDSIVIHMKKKALRQKYKFEFKRNSFSNFFTKEPDEASNVVRCRKLVNCCTCVKMI